MSCKPEPAIQSCDTDQLMPFFDGCQLTITWMCNIKFNIDYSLDVLDSKLVSVTFLIL